LNLLFFIPYPQHVHADIVQGQGISKIGKCLDLGLVKIPWSQANEHFGYIYSIEGLSFANVSDGPSIWQTSSYKSYNGFSTVDVLNNTPELNFSCPDKIVFATSASRSYKNSYRGILLFKYQDVYGALDFIQIENSTLLYRYWYNTSGQCDFNPKNACPAEEIKDTFPSIREFDFGQENDELEITGGDTFIYNAGLKISGRLKISNGTLILNGESAHLNTIEIGKNGCLTIHSEATLFLYGNLINNGTFSVNGGTVVLKGEAPQVISGETEFDYLEVENESYVETEQLIVKELSIFKGTFIPGTDSIFHNLFIDQAGVLSPAQGAYIFITGELDNTGEFLHNKGTVTLAGNNTQRITLNDDPFFNLDITGNTIVMDSMNIEGRLFIDATSEVSILPDDTFPNGAVFPDDGLPEK